MAAPISCGGCGEPLPAGHSICPSCGWDQTVSLARPSRRSLAALVGSAAWRVLVYGALLALPVAGFARFRLVGPGPDLATTLRWIARGDDGRAAELVTIHRAHEIATAAARYAVEELAPPPLEGDWQAVLSPYATMWVRGWMPLLFWAATTDLAPAGVREFFEVRSVDGWGRPYRIAGRPVPRDPEQAGDVEVAADLAAGLQISFFKLDTPSFGRDTEWHRIEITSAGRDGVLATGDDLRLVSYLKVGMTIQLSRRPVDLERSLEEAFTLGRHHFRLEGSRFDLIDARLLAEHRLDYRR